MKLTWNEHRQCTTPGFEHWFVQRSEIHREGIEYCLEGLSPADERFTLSVSQNWGTLDYGRGAYGRVKAGAERLANAMLAVLDGADIPPPPRIDRDAERRAALKRLDWSGKTTRHVRLTNPDLEHLPDGRYRALAPETEVEVHGRDVVVHTRFMLERIP